MGVFDRLFRKRSRIEPPRPVSEPSRMAESPVQRETLASPEAAPTEPVSSAAVQPAIASVPSDRTAPSEPDEADLDLELEEGATAAAWSVDVAAVDAAREAAERLALRGPQRITPSDPAGPGSLAQVLVELEARGLVTSQIVDDPELGFHVLYEPVKA